MPAEEIRAQTAIAEYVFSICTGALLCGAAGILRGVRVTTHRSVFHLLGYFGAIPVNSRVVVDGKQVSAAGITAGVDGALRVASLLRNDRVAQQIQLTIEYAPDPPFNCGTPQTAELLARSSRVSGGRAYATYASTSKRSLFSASMIFCISASCSCPKPFSASPFRSIFLVSGALHKARSSASSLKNSGSSPNKSSMNCWADMGVPSGCQNVVHTMCWMARSLPSASFTFAFFFLWHTHGR